MATIGGFVQIRTGQFDQVGELSQFDSPILDALSEEGCIQFQYNIDGTDNDRLNVYVQDYWTGRQSCMWHKNGSNVPNRWITAEAPLQLEKDGKYQVVFEARKGKAGGIGLVSLDHIIISSRRCFGTYPVEQCPYEEVPSSTSLMTTTTDSTTTADIATTANNFEINTSEIDTSINVVVITSTTYVHTRSDVEGLETTTEGMPKHLPLAGIIVGTVAGVLIVILIVGIYLNRHKLRARFSRKSAFNEQITPMYSNSNSSDGSVRLDNIR